MSDYQLTASEEPCAVIRTEDGACIPPDPANRDYAEYQQWVADGNKPDAYVPPEPVAPTASTEQQLIYDHENRIRALEGQAPITIEDLIDQMKGK